MFGGKKTNLGQCVDDPIKSKKTQDYQETWRITLSGMHTIKRG